MWLRLSIQVVLADSTFDFYWTKRGRYATQPMRKGEERHSPVPKEGRPPLRFEKQRDEDLFPEPAEVHTCGSEGVRQQVTEHRQLAMIRE